MIVFDLKCANQHTFEVWFRSSSDYETQKAGGFLECPYCGNTDVSKAIMAPNVTAKGNTKTETPVQMPAPTEKPTEKPVQTDVNMQAPASGVAAPAANIPAIDNLPPELAEAADKALREIREHVEKNCDDVGDQFAEEARKIHYGESDERGIYGTTTPEETADLLDEGIDIMPLPGGKPRVDG